MTPQDTHIAQETFIARLRRHRERNHVSLEQIGQATRVKPELFEAFERNDLSDWPRGLYARAWIRGYATVVGLDAIDTVDEFCRLFPNGDRRMGKTVQEVAAIVAHPSEYREDVAPEHDRRGKGQQVRETPPPAWYVAVARSAYQLFARVVPPLTTRRAGPGSARRATP
jgi:transcriptional regulator with XRE-family HTH domain